MGLSRLPSRQIGKLKKASDLGNGHGTVPARQSGRRPNRRTLLRYPSRRRPEGLSCCAVSRTVRLRFRSRAAIPYGVVVTQTGMPFFCQFGTNKLGSLDPSTVAIRE